MWFRPLGSRASSFARWRVRAACFSFLFCARGFLRVLLATPVPPGPGTGRRAQRGQRSTLECMFEKRPARLSAMSHRSSLSPRRSRPSSFRSRCIFLAPTHHPAPSSTEIAEEMLSKKNIQNYSNRRRETARALTKFIYLYPGGNLSAIKNLAV